MEVPTVFVLPFIVWPLDRLIRRWSEPTWSTSQERTPSDETEEL